MTAVSHPEGSGRFAIQTHAKGDILFVRSRIGLDRRITLSLVPTPEHEDTFPSIERAERWVRKISAIDPDLRLTVVPA